jgi:hypothetical protein
LALAKQSNAISQDMYKHSLNYRPVEAAMLAENKAGYDPNYYGAKERNVPMQQLAANILTQARSDASLGVGATSPSSVYKAQGVGGLTGYASGQMQNAAQAKTIARNDEQNIAAAKMGQGYPAQTTRGLESASGIASKAGDIAYQSLSAQRQADAAAKQDAYNRYTREYQIWAEQQRQQQDLENTRKYQDATQGGGWTFICTEMERQGWATPSMLKASKIYAGKLSPATYHGYKVWAKPFAKWLSERPGWSEFVSWFACPYMRWAQYQNVRNTGDEAIYSFRGAIVAAIGIPFCWLIGKIWRTSNERLSVERDSAIS